MRDTVFARHHSGDPLSGPWRCEDSFDLGRRPPLEPCEEDDRRLYAAYAYTLYEKSKNAVVGSRRDDIGALRATIVLNRGLSFVLVGSPFATHPMDQVEQLITGALLLAIASKAPAAIIEIRGQNNRICDMCLMPVNAAAQKCPLCASVVCESEQSSFASASVIETLVVRDGPMRFAWAGECVTDNARVITHVTDIMTMKAVHTARPPGHPLWLLTSAYAQTFVQNYELLADIIGVAVDDCCLKLAHLLSVAADGAEDALLLDEARCNDVLHRVSLKVIGGHGE